MPIFLVTPNIISEAGGILIILTFVHFFADWVLQTDAMARRKSDESPWLLVVHSFVYAAAFVPVLSYAFKFAVPLVASASLTLMMSHGAIDTYTPIWLWARFLRRPQEMRDDPVDGFTVWSSKPYGLLLTSGVDQFMHICFLAPIAVMASIAQYDKSGARVLGLYTLETSIGLAALSVAAIFIWNRRPPIQNPTPLEEDDEERPSMPSQHDE